MKLKIGAAVLALLLVGAGAVAAIPGHAADQADGHANDEQTTDTPEPPETPVEGNDTEVPADEVPDDNESESDHAGPPTDMPEQVPDHVVEIHETINQWLDGSLNGSLGDAISSIVGGDDASDRGNETDAADNGSDQRADGQARSDA